MSTLTLSSDTRIEWLPGSWPDRRGLRGWIGRRRKRGTWLATHVDWPGMWGDGATREEACDQLIDAMRACREAFPGDDCGFASAF